ncbi:sigma-70 family RNA polymerase sigma factor [Luteimicrobium xylanilyticum]|uniref:Putative ECF RNA polymerase sigma factor SigI n=1 Tax=Luteimicrobium xylanilyticum TaxID=1133546 RepID=A0A5P9Q5P4_9MICO|nr:sigma-70 family RNA polymerase sigma factor [Luteimicrobium xylanilyticum]QFU96576.1 putative ECF RNA polymerase sigma factor SigI [Luteimicrobium xylanilyticum]
MDQGRSHGGTVVEAFERERSRLVAVAHRMLGSRADAEDAVQEAWLRLSRQDAGTIDNLAGWLTTVVGRICVDALRARRTHPESGTADLPELVVTEDDDDPAEDAALADSVGLALLVVLDTLRPDERLAFVLHDMFAVPFDEIASVLDKSTDATKMLASRARRKVQGTPHPSDRRRQRAVVDAFLAASRAGDFEALLRVLDPDVVWTTHTSHGTTVRLGSTELARQAVRGRDARVTGRRVLVDGEPGIMTWGPTGKPLGLMACTVVEDRIVEVTSVLDARVLAAIDLPPQEA